MDYVLDAGVGSLARLGLILLATDETLEFEARGVLAGRDVQLLHARIPCHAAVTPETLAQMELALPATARLLPQGLGVLGYACTSGATVIGQQNVARAVQAVHPGVPVTDPLTAVQAALAALGARRIGLVSPYVASVTAPLCALLAAGGVEVAREVSFGQSDDWTVARIAPASSRAALLEAGRATGIDAVFASCTNLQTFSVLEEVEAVLDLPVITSNQALLWHMLRLAGVDARGWGPGRLFRL